MKQRKHLKYYKECMVAGKMGTDGLCSAARFDIIDQQTLELFTPSDDDIKQLVEDKQLTVGSSLMYSYWVSGVIMSHPGRVNEFTELRQTIILFMAAINNEL